jgi:hypothetical protein
MLLSVKAGTTLEQTAHRNRGYRLCALLEFQDLEGLKVRTPARPRPSRATFRLSSRRTRRTTPTRPLPLGRVRARSTTKVRSRSARSHETLSLHAQTRR